MKLYPCLLSFFPDIEISIVAVVTASRGVDINNQIFYNTQGNQSRHMRCETDVIFMPELEEKFSSIISVCPITALFTSL